MNNKSKMILGLVAALAFTSQSAMAQESPSKEVGPKTSIEASGKASLGATASLQSGEARTYLDVLVLLEGNGYVIQEVKSTLLGRVMITAANREHLREIVMSRTTGEIMSDVILEVFVTGEASGDAVTEAPVEEGADGGAGTSVNVNAGASVSIGGGGSNGGGNVSTGGSAGVSIGLGN